MYSYCYVLFCIFCFHHANCHSLATLTEVFPCFLLSCKANARVQLAKTGHGPRCPQINCVILCIVCVYMCTVLLPPGVNPIAVNKYLSYFYSKTNKVHQCIKFILFWNDTLCVWDYLSVHHQEFKTVHTATGIYSLQILLYHISVFVLYSFPLMFVY